MDGKDRQIAALCSYIDKLHEQIRNDDIAFAELSDRFTDYDTNLGKWRAADEFEVRMDSLRLEVVW